MPTIQEEIDCTLQYLDKHVGTEQALRAACQDYIEGKLTWPGVVERLARWAAKDQRREAGESAR